MSTQKIFALIQRCKCEFWQHMSERQSDVAPIVISHLLSQFLKDRMPYICDKNLDANLWWDWLLTETKLYFHELNTCKSRVTIGQISSLYKKSYTSCLYASLHYQFQLRLQWVYFMLIFLVCQVVVSYLLSLPKYWPIMTMQ